MPRLSSKLATVQALAWVGACLAITRACSLVRNESASLGAARGASERSVRCTRTHSPVLVTADKAQRAGGKWSSSDAACG